MKLLNYKQIWYGIKPTHDWINSTLHVLLFFDCDVLNKKDTVVSVDLFEACEKNLQDFSISQKIGVIPQIHSASHGFSPTNPKTRAIWVRKDLLRWALFICLWFNFFNCLWPDMFCLCFLLFFFKKKKKNKTKQNKTCPQIIERIKSKTSILDSP